VASCKWQAASGPLVVLVGALFLSLGRKGKQAAQREAKRRTLSARQTHRKAANPLKWSTKFGRLLFLLFPDLWSFQFSRFLGGSFLICSASHRPIFQLHFCLQIPPKFAQLRRSLSSAGKLARRANVRRNVGKCLEKCGQKCEQKWGKTLGNLQEFRTIFGQTSQNFPIQNSSSTSRSLALLSIA